MDVPNAVPATYIVGILNSSTVAFNASLRKFDGGAHSTVDLHRTFSLTTGFYSYTYTFSVCFIGFTFSITPGLYICVFG